MMTIEELAKKIDFHPKERKYTQKVEYSSKLQGWEFDAIHFLLFANNQFYPV